MMCKDFHMRIKIKLGPTKNILVYCLSTCQGLFEIVSFSYHVELFLFSFKFALLFKV